MFIIHLQFAYHIHVAAVVNFGQSTYIVNEDSVLQPMLILSNLLSTDLNIDVLTTDNSTREYY